mgnify:FL=1
MSYKIISKTIALTLAIFTLFNSITVSIYATELNPKTDTITDILDVDSNENSGSAPYLGGGPSPSASWEKSGTYKVTYTAKQAANLAYKAKKAEAVGKISQAAYNVTLTLMGELAGSIPGITGKVAGGFTGYIAAANTFGHITRNSYRVIKKAADSEKRVTITFQRYKRPANSNCLAEAISYK